jgi:dienelactone hydrolase
MTGSTINVRVRIAAAALVFLLIRGAATAHAIAPVTLLETPDGARFGIQGDKPPRPAPTLFVFATGIEQTLPDPAYNKVGHLLAEQGWLCVGIDLPCHGQDVRADEPAGLDGWAARLRGGEDFMAKFTSRCSAVLSHLIEQGYTDPERVAVCGTSRGGFSALHFAIADPRVSAVAALAPVTELPILQEFKGLEDDSLTRSLALDERASALAGRSVWMCIGNNDDRVGTDACIAFSRRIVTESVAAGKPAPVEMHVMVTEGHRTHPTAHDEIAAWIAARFAP